VLHFTLSPGERDQTRAAVSGLAPGLDALAERSGTELIQELPVAARRLP